MLACSHNTTHHNMRQQNAALDPPLLNLASMSVMGAPASSCAGVSVTLCAAGTLSVSLKPMDARFTYSLTVL